MAAIRWQAWKITLGIERVFGIELSGTEVYEYPTIGEMAAYLQHRGSNRESRVSLAEDSILDPEISPRGSVRTTRLSEASSVLVTGATGFLGAFLLDELLRATGQDTRYYCLVRDRTSELGRPVNRVLENLKFYGLAGQYEEDRIIPVTGDITQPRLGLKDDGVSGAGGQDRPDISLRRLRQLCLSLFPRPSPTPSEGRWRCSSSPAAPP